MLGDIDADAVRIQATGPAGPGSLPGAGLGPETFAWAAGGAIVLLLGATLLIVSRRRARGRDEG